MFWFISLPVDSVSFVCLFWGQVIPGEHGFIAQLNEGRHLKKRPTEFRVDKVLQPFDETKFNFTKVGQEEILFQFEASTEGDAQFFPNAAIDVENSPSFVAINVCLSDFILFAVPFCRLGSGFKLQYFFCGYHSDPSYCGKLGANAAIIFVVMWLRRSPNPLHRDCILKFKNALEEGSVEYVFI
jgi:hypothetical protein